MSDILFRTDSHVFSYRVAGICVHDGKVLLQKPSNDTGYAFPGGHVELGETGAEALKREFMEEIGARATVGELKWVWEIFFPWGDKPCHQICLYYIVSLDMADIPSEGKFIAKEQLDGREFDLEFFWIPIEELSELTVYPQNITGLMTRLDEGVQHFIYRE